MNCYNWRKKKKNKNLKQNILLLNLKLAYFKIGINLTEYILHI